MSRILLEILSSAVSGCLVVKCRNDSSESLERDFHVFFGCLKSSAVSEFFDFHLSDASAIFFASLLNDKLKTIANQSENQLKPS